MVKNIQKDPLLYANIFCRIRKEIKHENIYIKDFVLKLAYNYFSTLSFSTTKLGFIITITRATSSSSNLDNEIYLLVKKVN